MANGTITTTEGGFVFGSRSARNVRTRETVVGLPELETMLTKLMPREAKNLSRRMVTGIAADVRDDMRKVVPTRSRTLKKAIRSARTRGRPGVAEAGVFITHGKGQKNDAFYWHMVEFGTLKDEEKPYIRPTVLRWEQKLSLVWRLKFGVELEKSLAKQAAQQSAARSRASTRAVIGVSGALAGAFS